MAVDPTTPQEASPIVPATVHVDYTKQVASTDKFADIQNYTVDKIYGMLRTDLENVGVSPERISFSWFAFFLREILNDYSRHVGEFQIAMRFESGGAAFKIPGLSGIISLNVNGYPGTQIGEGLITDYRAGDESTSSDEWYYSLNGNLLGVYPALGSGDIITLLASVFAEDFSEDSADKIILHGDFSALFHGIRWKCRESHGKDYMEAKQTYLTKRGEQQSHVEGQMFSSQILPAPHLT